MKPLLMLSLIAVATSSLANILPGEKTTYWKDDLGSYLKLIDDGNGHLTGSFLTLTGCDSKTPQPVIGTYNGNVISFTVNFKNCSSITAWVGHLSADGDKMTTLWQLSDGTKPEWASVLTGYNLFTRMPDQTKHRL